jgi:hypothetical protein
VDKIEVIEKLQEFCRRIAELADWPMNDERRADRESLICEFRAFRQEQQEALRKVSFDFSRRELLGLEKRLRAEGGEFEATQVRDGMDILDQIGWKALQFDKLQDDPA